MHCVAKLILIPIVYRNNLSPLNYITGKHIIKTNYQLLIVNEKFKFF